MSLVIIILLSSFFFIHAYQEKVNQATISKEQLLLFDTIDVFADANMRLTSLIIAGNDKAWLHLAKLYAKNNAHIAYQLGEYYLNKGQGKTAQLWLQEAIRQQYQPARLALASYFFKVKQYDEIKSLLWPILGQEEALILLYKLAIQLGDTHFISQYQSTLAKIKSHDFYSELVDYSVFDVSKSTLNKQCHIDVQLFATNLAGLRHGKKLVSQFKKHQLAAHICLQTPKYISPSYVNCQHSKQERITCQADVWGNRSDISSRYIGLIVEQGGANVDNGIMYLDQQDGIDVLTHELAHFLGFIDEYPLPVQHQKCAQVQQSPFSHNLAVLKQWYYGERTELRERILKQLAWANLIKASTPILTKSGQGWKLATPKKYQDRIGVFSAHACDNNFNLKAFKPYFHRTKLEYFELEFPQAYLDIMAIAPDKYLMPSYHFNVSRDLY